MLTLIFYVFSPWENTVTYKYLNFGCDEIYQCFIIIFWSHKK